MASIKLPFKAVRNGSTPVTDASEIDVVVDGETISLQERLSEKVYTEQEWADLGETGQDESKRQYTDIYVV